MSSASLVLPGDVESDSRLWVPESPVPARSEPVGVQTPTHFVAPLWHTSAADDAIDLAAVAGLELLPWQQIVLRNALGEKHDRWAAFEVGLVVPRQNGKNVVIMARQLAGLFLFGEELQVHTSHRFKTTRAAHRDLVKLIEGVPDLKGEVQACPTSTENTAIILRNGNRIEFLARQGGSGRGLSGDTVYLDEAFNLSTETVSDLMPTLSARRRPQLWYTSSAGMESSEVLSALRERVLKAPEDEKTLAYFEWSARLDEFEWDSVEAVQQSNPSLGYFQDWEWIENAELRTMREHAEEQYKRERLGVWAEKGGDAVIGPELWRAAEVDAGDVAGLSVLRRSLAVEVTRDRDMAVIAGAAELEDGRVLVEILDQKAGVAWLPETCKFRHQRSKAWAGVVMDSYGGAAAVAPHIIAAGVPVKMASTQDLARGTQDFYDRLAQRDEFGGADPQVLHASGGSGFLDDAAFTARRRLMGSSKTAWTWAEGSAAVSLAPLRAVTLAVAGLGMEPVKRKRRRVA
ncbi:MAG: hypothetical protein E7D38_06235 [Staphylococcus epidermidis]|nr:hypothetical protein [Staphylococcus epidermidis]